MAGDKKKWSKSCRNCRNLGIYSVHFNDGTLCHIVLSRLGGGNKMGRE